MKLRIIFSVVLCFSLISVAAFGEEEVCQPVLKNANSSPTMVCEEGTEQKGFVLSEAEKCNFNSDQEKKYACCCKSAEAEGEEEPDSPGGGAR